jgi:NAD(P)-dependent dehydrogenase (short-subunit alcohol dehydrogenase family)
MNGRLESKTALVTGGACGIGKAIARRLSSDGARVVITDVQRDAGLETAAAYDVVFLDQDVRQEERWAEVIDEVEERFGHLNVLVNNAGILGQMDMVTPENTPLASWREIFSVNAEGVFLGCRAAIPAMRRAGGGAIVNISSVAAQLATPQATAYGSSKAAVRQLTKSVAQYCAEQHLKIRCNSVHPHNVLTPLWVKAAEERAVARGIPLDVVMAEGEAGTPMGEFVLPEEVAAVVAFLASDEAPHITGAELIVDSGVVNCDTYFWPGVRSATLGTGASADSEVRPGEGQA